PDNSCGYTLIISIKNDYSEAHVYLPPEPKPLPNHFILPAQAIWHFTNIQLKSDTHNLSSDPFYNILYTPNFPNTSYQPLLLSICTHNVRGYNEDLKQQVWEDYCLSNNLNIIGITETKISQDNAIIKLQKSQHYSYYWSCSNSSKAGTAIMIQNYLKPHIHNILKFHGYAIAIDLFFKHDFKFRIISTYLPCDDSQLRLLAQNTIIQWIQEAEHKNILPIVIGDFNATNDTQSPSIKSKLLSFLQHNNMYIWHLIQILQHLLGIVIVIIVVLITSGPTIHYYAILYHILLMILALVPVVTTTFSILQ